MRGVRSQVVGASLLLLAACSTGRPWGNATTLTPSWTRVQRAAIDAATDPQTWAPLAGAALLQIGDADDEIADWARDETPLFGSNRTAEDVSDALLDVSRAGWIASLLLTPSGNDPGPAAFDKAKGAVAELGGLAATLEVVNFIKDETGRLRPDGTNRRSFPSAHTSGVASFGVLTRRHAEAMPLRPWQRDAIFVGTTAATALTGWARVEGGRHHPADTLVGWGLANFLNAFVHDAFIGRSRCRFRVQPAGNGVQIGLQADL